MNSALIQRLREQAVADVTRTTPSFLVTPAAIEQRFTELILEEALKFVESDADIERIWQHFETRV